MNLHPRVPAGLDAKGPSSGPPPVRVTDLLSPRPRTLGCILGNSASALRHKRTSQATSWHLAPPLCKIRPQRPIKRVQSSAPQKRGHRRGKLPRSPAKRRFSPSQPGCIKQQQPAEGNHPSERRDGGRGSSGVCLQPQKRRLHIKKEETDDRMTHPFSEKLTKTKRRLSGPGNAAIQLSEREN